MQSSDTKNRSLLVAKYIIFGLILLLLLSLLLVQLSGGSTHRQCTKEIIFHDENTYTKTPLHYTWEKRGGIMLGTKEEAVELCEYVTENGHEPLGTESSMTFKKNSKYGEYWEDVALLGFDDDEDGIRDDFEDQIQVRYGHLSPDSQSSIAQLTIALRQQLLAIDSTENAIEAARQVARARECVDRYFTKEEMADIEEYFSKQLFDGNESREAYQSFQELIQDQGTIPYTLRAGENTCDDLYELIDKTRNIPVHMETGL